ncbi:MAG: hypothetical protein ABIJ09_08535 [Pseudomonadota bacterium]
MSLLVLGLTLNLLTAPPDLGARGSIDGELSAGALASSGSAGAAAGAQTEWVPGLDLDLRLRRQHLAAGYHPRLVLRWPQAVDGRPLVLHRLTLRYDATPARRARVNARFYLDAGDTAYGRSLFVFDGAALSSSVPTVDVLSFLSSGADASLRWRLDRRQDLLLSTSLGYNTPLGTPPVAGLFPEQLRGTIEVGYTLAAARRQELVLDVQGRGVQFRPGPTYLALRPTAQWKALVNAHWTTTIVGGALLAQQQGTIASTNVLRTPLMPVAEIGVDGRERLARRVPAHVDLRVGLDGYFDPVAASLSPLASARSMLELALGPHALASAQAYVYIPLGSEAGLVPGWGRRDPLLAGGDVRISPWSQRDLRLDCGVRGFGLWTTATGLILQRSELVGFVGLRAGLDAGA